MLHALRVGAETVEADSSWFADEEPASELATLLPLPEDAPPAPTTDRPVGDLPVTEAMSAKNGPAASPRSFSAAAIAAPDKVPDALSRSPRGNHFIPVGQHELDPPKADEPQPRCSRGRPGRWWGLAAGGRERVVVSPAADGGCAVWPDRRRIAEDVSHPFRRAEVERAKSDINEFLIRYPNDKHAARCARV